MRNKIKDILENNYYNTGFDLQTATDELLNLFSVSNNEASGFSDGVAFANYIENKWLEYRGITNNEDAWSFKQWLVGK